MTDPSHRVFIDSSFFIALFIRAESRHQLVADQFKTHVNAQDQFLTSNDILDETITRLRTAEGLHAAKKFYTHTQTALKTHALIQIFIDEAIQNNAWSIITKYHDHELSMTDATSIAILQQFNLKTILTLDQHFSACGLKSLPKLPQTRL